MTKTTSLLTPQSVRPQLQKRVLTLCKDNKFLFLDPDKPDWLVTNQNGATAISLCDGRLSIEAIADKISQSANKNLHKDVTSFLLEIKKTRSFFDTDIETGGFNHKLRIAQFSLTQKCNLQCIYCYATSRPKTTSSQSLSLQEYIRLIDDINTIQKGVGIALTGGEPLLSKNCISIGKYAAESGNSPHLLTNAILISNKNAKELADTFSLIKISLDGNETELHDLHRGAGSFSKVMRGIDKLDAHDAKISLSMTVTQKNIHNIASMSAQFGKRLTFQPLFTAGRGAGLKDLTITGSEYYNALSSTKGVNPLARLSSMLDNARNKGIYKCAIGDGEISISETGDVFPCQLLHDEKFLAGNIRSQPLQEIYDNSSVLRMCRTLDVNNVKGCQECAVRLICGGACRARAFHEKGKIDVSGDFCEYEEQAIINGIFDSYKI